MIKNLIFKTLFSLGLLINTISIKSEIKNPKDSIKVEGINNICTWINSPQNYKHANQTIEITANKGTDLFHFPGEGYDRCNTPMLVFNADKDFVFSAKVSANFDSAFDGAFLVMFKDSVNYAKLLFELNPQNKLVICTGVTKRYTDDNVNAILQNKEIYLKIGKKGELFVFYYSIDGEKWNIARFFRFDKRENLKLGFGAQSPTGENCTGIFSEIKYSPKALKDPLKGD